jgi:glutaredoxin
MKRFIGSPVLAILVLFAFAPPAFAWDPVSILNNAVQGQVNRQINRGVAEVFRSIENPSTGARPTNVEIREARPGEVVLYATPSCGYCKQARAHMQSRNIAYLEKDVSSNAQAETEWRNLGGRGVPLIIMGEHKLTGFSAASFDKTYAQFQTEQASSQATAQATLPAAPATTSATPNPPAVAFIAGDVLIARIARVKLLSDAQPVAKATGQLARNEEVIYLGEAQGRYLKVRSADVEGWVDHALLAKP